jgi:hypothetical protein
MFKKAAITAAAMSALCAPAFADDAGKMEYMIACAVCHGESAAGEGPMAEHLNIAVPGLTTLAQNNDGVFPFLETFMVIDGRTGVRGHGSEMMPVWGDRYKQSAMDTGEFGAEVVARGRVLSLVYYLESIQE